MENMGRKGRSDWSLAYDSGLDQEHSSSFKNTHLSPSLSLTYTHTHTLLCSGNTTMRSFWNKDRNMTLLIHAYFIQE